MPELTRYSNYDNAPDELKRVVMQIIEKTAREIVGDSMMSPKISGLVMKHGDKVADSLAANIAGIFVNDYMNGVMQIPVVFDKEKDEIISYAVIFKVSDEIAFLHKVFTNEQYRGQGYGTDMVKTTAKLFPNVWLMCLDGMIEFYKGHGFKSWGIFNLGEASEKGMSIAGLAYAGAQVMSIGDNDLVALYLMRDEDFKLDLIVH